MFDILVIGGGFAGVWSALAAARLRANAPLTIGLVTPGDDLVIRPRLYEADPGSMRVPLDRVLGPIGVERIAATAVAVDDDAVRVVDRAGNAHTLGFRRLVLATGSAVLRPGLDYVHNVDTMAAAVALNHHLRTFPSTAVVVGAGFTGLEVATELAGRHPVILVERTDSVGLGPGPREVIAAALDQLGIEVRLNTNLASAWPTGVRLSDGTEIEPATAIWTAGMTASPLAGQVPGQHDHLGRLVVDPYLRAPESPHVFVAGDTAAADDGGGHQTLQCCQHAIPLGRFAGHNAAADLLGLAPLPFSAEPYVTCLDLGPAGAVFTTGYDRTVQLTGQEAKTRKRLINQHRIYPPVDDPAALLAAGDPARTWADTPQLSGGKVTGRLTRALA